MRKYDFLVIGGGIAGLTYALEVADHGTVAVLFKKGFTESSTAWAQGGIAAVQGGDDNFELHIQDTLIAGAGLCNPEIVKIVVTEGPERVRELIARGAQFDVDQTTHEYHLHREGGHSRRRILHAADATGFEIQQTLLKAVKAHKNIEIFDYTNAIDLVTTRKRGMNPDLPNRVLGAYVLTKERKVQAFVADKVFVATGGAGKIYLYTSNPDVATGDGIAMCYRAGVSVANLEFFQFHPTCLYHPKAKSFLISEAMRGEGAKLRRINGERFMDQYHPDAELAPRDIVARAIDNEMKVHGEEHVLLDMTHKEPGFVQQHFPTIYQKCLSFGFDLEKEPIPVVPAAHYCCGGVVCDQHGQTTIEGLFVGGEVAHTGLHGANRLASNSLLEGVVFGYRAAKKSIATRSVEKIEFSVPDWDPGTAVKSDEQVVILQNWDEIRRFMWNYVGVVRSDKRLERALRRSQLIEQEIDDYYWNFTITSDLLELRNLSLVANLVIRSAMQRKESRGLHYSIDYPPINSSLKSADRGKDTIIAPE